MTVFTSDEEDKIFSYWESLPVVTVISPNNYEKILSQDLRVTIYQIMKQGIEDRRSNGTRQRRHVLAATEIREQLEQHLKMSIKLPGLYFHLTKLEDHNIISPAFKIKEGKNNVTYFGLTAQHFITKNQEGIPTSRDDWIKPLVDQLQVISDDISGKLINNVIAELEEFDTIQDKEFNNWVRSIRIHDYGQHSAQITFLLSIFKHRKSGLKHLHKLLKLLGD